MCVCVCVCVYIYTIYIYMCVCVCVCVCVLHCLLTLSFLCYNNLAQYYSRTEAETIFRILNKMELLSFRRNISSANERYRLLFRNYRSYGNQFFLIK